MTDDFELIPEVLDTYACEHTSEVDVLLRQLDRDTHVNVLNPRMISGSFQGKFLELVSRMIRPGKILEVGTYTGYSAICLAKGLEEGGSMLTIEHNPELRSRILRYFEKAGISHQVELVISEAMDVLPRLEDGSFDLVFLDADKSNYMNYYPHLKRLLTKGGWLIADNVLWSGKVYDPTWTDRDTLVLREFNDYVQADPDMENILLPIRDGITLARKLV